MTDCPTVSITNILNMPVYFLVKRSCKGNNIGAFIKKKTQALSIIKRE